MKRTNFKQSLLICLWTISGCTAVKTTKTPAEETLPSLPAVVDKPKEDIQLDIQPLEAKTSKDPCKAANAQEAWLALEDEKPALGNLVTEEVYYASEGTKMIAVSQQKRENYGDASKAYVEVAAEVVERGSRVGSYAQVIATRKSFAEAVELYTSLPPFWQQQVQEPQAVLVMKHYLLGKKNSGYIKFENEIVTDLSTKLEQGVELRCRSNEACRCI